MEIVPAMPQTWPAGGLGLIVGPVQVEATVMLTALVVEPELVVVVKGLVVGRFTIERVTDGRVTVGRFVLSGVVLGPLRVTVGAVMLATPAQI